MTVAASGDWLAELRVRFVSIARRRVEPDAVEDVAQEALRVVIERGLSGPGGPELNGLPPLAWCFQVLRNTIGNHYRRRGVRRSRLRSIELVATRPDTRATPLEACEAAEVARVVRLALTEMARADPDCSRRLWAVAEGSSPGQLAREESVDEASFYRRLYRCREKLRVRLVAMGLSA